MMAETAKILLEGERVPWGAGVFVEELGVNDPLTHLEQYLANGEAAISSIDEDLITDCAERLEKPLFINPVTFDHRGRDFISRENKFSMRAMTSKTEYKFAGDVADIQLYQRAKIESREVDRLVEWFDTAEANDAFIVESLPLTETENCTIVRIYQKVNSQGLTEHIITLHNSSTELFNQLHAELGADVPDSQTPLELLDNMYTYRPPNSQNFQNFIEQYVATYDGVLAAQHPGREFHFGLEDFQRPDMKDDIARVRAQKALRSVYLDGVRAFGKSRGKVTPEIIRLDSNLGLSKGLSVGAVITSLEARAFLDDRLQYIVATLNRAPDDLLRGLEASQDKGTAYNSAGHYGGEAAAAGIRYDGACPSGSPAAATKEAAALAHGHRHSQDPTKCIVCPNPNCRKLIDADKEYYDRGWWHCPKCKATAARKGVKQYAIPERSDKPLLSAFDILSLSLKKYRHEFNIKKILSTQAVAETEFERRRQAKLLEQEQSELQKLTDR